MTDEELIKAAEAGRTNPRNRFVVLNTEDGGMIHEGTCVIVAQRHLRLGAGRTLVRLSPMGSIVGGQS